MRYIVSLLLLIITAVPVLAEQQQQAALVKTKQLAATTAAPTKTFIGTLYFDRISQLSSEVNGRIDKVLFREGDIVKQGQPLVELNTDFIRKEIDRITAMIALTQAQLDHAEKDLKRYEELLEKQATSATAFDQLFYSVAEIKAQKAAYEAELASARLQLKKSVIPAPFAGRVLDKNVDVGNWITSGSAIARLGALSDIYLQVPVSEKLLPFSHQGEEIAVKMTATGEQLTGIHQGFRPAADAQTKNLFVRIKLAGYSNPFEFMSAEVTLPIAKKSDQLLVPRDALVTFNGQKFFYSIKDGKAALVPVQIIGFSGDNASIQSPHAQPGMPVVVEGNERLRPDQPVNVVEE
ncbi:efflux RND transporter periplasmic adaptor subunit [Desulfuromonas acetoxidans]|uniref:Secretion protein HlyD n=1 Tax=Desulfuromonas acetoxidans (strain DSM 684 / 11070) TaxID=281689 RepID=Q1JVZ3_DESA6|nr:efflux RND transporter periplasmic adaptor subunit [Desulfuromonas acetoxidans]EAT14412.1 secretion protein HlyD [Desulfuromonas acetoxidans DSM 684]MBF0646554.1 efflux RND transporter periplasmic adaptor subunit [Desulfuromonas acetoxidans]NVD25687.1 efflux RND transporter periplasmic adaptor subunit [Desulfuromonas acetoxidans]NVE16983.1 efflux RND transporter periplasmic adaptor subunit [Desulfuromonas acetoxidans]